MRTLLDFRYQQHIKAGRGEHGKGKNMHGRSAEDKIVKVPPGTQVRDAENNKLLADLVKETYIAAKGGRGGRGNARFASATDKAPRFAEKGEPGEERWLWLELKLIADVGLVGFPNAGKSTLLSRVTAARPKIASYPFTTLSPNLGVVQVEGVEPFVMADIPGLISGAHAGAGLGHNFLRHIERTRLLLQVVDAAGVDGRSPLEDYRQIEKELELYDERLALLPRVVAANVFPISAVTGSGVRELIYHIARLLEELPPGGISTEEQAVVLSPGDEEDALAVVQESGIFIMKEKRLEKLAAMTDFNNEEAAKRFQRLFRLRGYEEALKKAGAQSGDTVKIGDLEFIFQEED
jgi:GTP-binding protein